MLPIGVIMATIWQLLNSSALGESPNRPISLAETLRRLPLSFFGERDLSDLTATMISDCAHLDMMFSHHIPVLAAACISTTLIAVLLFAVNLYMALAILWVVPIAVLLTAGSRKLQDKYGARNVMKKRAVTDSIQECLETIRNLKSDNMEEGYLDEFNAKLYINRMRVIQEEPVQSGTEDFEPNNFDIVFDRVDFSYHGEGEIVLKDVSFTAKQGEVTAFVGPSGGGKSTATKLAARRDEFVRGLPDGYETMIGENGKSFRHMAELQQQSSAWTLE
jgi:ABC-type multidrug transport system fused ATPase/permease subunit